jgi:hypothetical protein
MANNASVDKRSAHEGPLPSTRRARQERLEMSDFSLIPSGWSLACRRWSVATSPSEERGILSDRSALALLSLDTERGGSI